MAETYQPRGEPFDTYAVLIKEIIDRRNDSETTNDLRKISIDGLSLLEMMNLDKISKEDRLRADLTYILKSNMELTASVSNMGGP